MTSLQHPSTKEDILRHLLKHGGTTAQTLAEQLGVSPQAIRRHLKDLEAEGLIDHQAIQAGMGRPNYLYVLSQKGRDHFPDQYDEFALSLLNTLAETVGKDQMGHILRKQWERKALDYRSQLGEGSLATRVEALVALRKQEGYMAEWHEVDAGSAQDLDQKGTAQKSTAQKSTAQSHCCEEDLNNSDRPRYIITEYNCAISQIAETFPSVCGHELEMFAVALPDCTVQRTHWLVNGEHRCGYLIEAKA